MRYAGGNLQSFESDVADGPTDRLTYLRRSTNEAKKFAPHMHEVSVPHDQLLAHAHAVLRRYHTFVNVVGARHVVVRVCREGPWDGKSRPCVSFT